jgi:hypothetical protein
MLTRLTETLIEYTLGFVNAVKRTLEDKLGEIYSVKDFGAKGDGVTDDTVAITNALAGIPAGGKLYFPSGKYLAANIRINKPVTILGDNWHETGTVFYCSSQTLPYFYADGAGHISMRDFHLRPQDGVVRSSTGRAMLEFKNSFRLHLRDFFFWDYNLAIDFDGCTEVYVDSFEAFTGLGGQGIGFCRLGNTSYTGPVAFDNFHIKGYGAVSPEYGFRAKWTDVLSFGPGSTVILHDACLEVAPSAGQISSLLRVQGIWDTAKYGIKVSPVGGTVQAMTIYGAYAGAQTVAAIAIDGTQGSINAVQVLGCDCINSAIGVDVTGAGSKGIYVSSNRISNNVIGLHMTNNPDVDISSNEVGDFGFAGNVDAVAMDGTVKGYIRHNLFRGNVNPVNINNYNVYITGNAGANDAIPYVPTVTFAGGASAVVSANAQYRYRDGMVDFTAQIFLGTVTAQGEALLIGLPAQFNVVSQASQMVGRENKNTGKLLQGFLLPGTGNNIRVCNYDNSSPVQTGAEIYISGSYAVPQ